MILLVSPGCANTIRTSEGERAATVALASLHPHFAEHQVALLNELQQRDESPRLISLTFSEHWGRLQIVDRTVTDGTLMCVVYRTIRDCPDVEQFVLYQTHDPGAIASLLQLAAECERAGDYVNAAYVNDSFDRVARWNACMGRGAVSSSTPPADLSRFIDQLLILRNESLHRWNSEHPGSAGTLAGRADELHYHPAAYLDLAIRIFDERESIRHGPADAP